MEISSTFNLIERMAALIRSEERKRCAEHGLQLVHLQVLDYLTHCNKYSDTPAAVANYLGMTRGTVSQTLLLLEKKGYLKKTSDTVDRRVVHLSLLPPGQEVLQQAKPSRLFEEASDKLKQGGSKQYEKVLSEILTALQKSNQSYTFGLCRTCKFFTACQEGYLCGLTKEPLSESDGEKICQEHTIG